MSMITKLPRGTDDLPPRSHDAGEQSDPWDADDEDLRGVDRPAADRADSDRPDADPDRPDSDSDGADVFFLGTPSAPRASFTTVASIFATLAVAQVAVLAISGVSFELPAFRLMLGTVILAPAVLYAFVAAWDRRQLLASGHDRAPLWEWALVFPPVYLALRWIRLGTPGRPRAAALGWSVAELVATVAFILIATTVLTAGPNQRAGASSGAIDGPITGAQIAEFVEDGWADAGADGEAECGDPASQTPGTAVECTGALEDAPLSFTATLGDVAAGQPAIVISRWVLRAS